MKELKKLHLKSANVLSEKEMKQVFGGSGAEGSGAPGSNCAVGEKCSVRLIESGVWKGKESTGTCQKEVRGDGSVLCYCDAYGDINSGSGNWNGVSHCWK